MHPLAMHIRTTRAPAVTEWAQRTAAADGAANAGGDRYIVEVCGDALPIPEAEVALEV